MIEPRSTDIIWWSRETMLGYEINSKVNIDRDVDKKIIPSLN